MSSYVKKVVKVLHFQYKPSIIFVLATLVLLMAWFQVSPFDPLFFLLSAAVGIAQSYLIVWTGHRLLSAARQRKVATAWLMLFAPVPEASLALILSGVLAFSLPLFLPVLWTAKALIGHLTAFLWGSALGVILYELYGTVWARRDRQMPYALDRDRLDTIAGTMLTSALLGAGFHLLPDAQDRFGGAGGVLLATGLAMVQLLGAYTVLILQKTFAKAWVGRVADMLLPLVLAAAAYLLVNTFLPANWLMEGREYATRNVLLVVWAAQAASTLAGYVVDGYYALTDRYISSLLGGRRRSLAYNLIMRFGLNVLIGSLPMLCTVGALIAGYLLADIYGLALAMLVLATNLHNSFIIEVNRLNFDRIVELTNWERIKLTLVSPDFRTVLRTWTGR